MPLGSTKHTKPADSLDQCRRKLIDADKGYRRTVYDAYQDTLESAVMMAKNKRALAIFVKRNKITRNVPKKSDVASIVDAAFVFVTRSKGAGWKGARVCRFLHEVRNIEIRNIAKKLDELGGIEEVVKLAAIEDPRRSKRTKVAAHDKKSGLKKSPRKIESELSVDEWNDSGPDEGMNIDQARTTVSMQTARALLAQIMMVPPGDPFTLDCVRLDHSSGAEAAAEIQQVRRN